MSHKRYNVTLFGCGKMGHAMLSAWLKNDLVHAVTVIDPHNKPDIESNCITYLPEFTSLTPCNSDILVIAVKPQILRQVFYEIAQYIEPNTIILSIAAGQSLSALEAIFGVQKSIIRTMPNTPAAIGKGISVAISNRNTTAEQRDIANQILGVAGLVEWIDEESLMDAVTALSGSGPAYVFHFIECLAQAGENIGLEKNMAMTLARQTVIGSAALAEYSTDTSAEILRQNVTSPNGTTQAALDVLMNGKLQDILTETLYAAQKRSKELNDS